MCNEENKQNGDKKHPAIGRVLLHHFANRDCEKIRLERKAESDGPPDAGQENRNKRLEEIML